MRSASISALSLFVLATPAASQSGFGSACASGIVAPSPRTEGQLLLGTGTPGGVYQQFASGLERVSEPPGPSLLRVSTLGSVQNLCLLAAGSVDLALVQSDVAHLAWFRHEPFKSLPQSQTQALRIVAPLFTEAVHIFVAPHSDITSTSQMKGKRVWIGRGGTGHQRNAIRILQASGLSSDDLARLQLDMLTTAQSLAHEWDASQLSLADLQLLGFDTQEAFADFTRVNLAVPFPALLKMLENGQLDAVFHTTAIASDRIQTEFSGKGNREIRLLDLEWDVIERVLRLDPSYIEAYIPRGTYTGQSTGTLTVGVQSLLLARADVSADAIERLAQVVNLKRASIEASMGHVKLDLLGVRFPERLNAFRHARGFFPNLGYWNIIEWFLVLLAFAGVLQAVRKVPRLRDAVKRNLVVSLVLSVAMIIVLCGAQKVQLIEGHVNEKYGSLFRSAFSMVLYATISPERAPFSQEAREYTRTFLAIAGFLFSGLAVPALKNIAQGWLFPASPK